MEFKREEHTIAVSVPLGGNSEPPGRSILLDGSLLLIFRTINTVANTLRLFLELLDVLIKNILVFNDIRGDHEQQFGPVVFFCLGI